MMFRTRRVHVETVIAVMFVVAPAICTAAEPVFRLSTDRQQYLYGEPVILKMVIDVSELTDDRIKILQRRTGEACIVTRSEGRQFPPVPTCTNLEHRGRVRSGARLEELIFLQPVQFAPWLKLKYMVPREVRADYLAAGTYSVHVEQRLAGSPTTAPIRSNAVEFTVIEPTGAAALALADLTSTPAVLSIAGDERFPSLAGDRTVVAQSFAFVKRHGDTPYGQFVVARCAFESATHQDFQFLAALYPVLGRAVEARRETDLIAEHLRFAYLVAENIFEEDFNPQLGLRTMEEFERTLTDSPPWLRPDVRRWMKGYQDVSAGRTSLRKGIERSVMPFFKSPLFFKDGDFPTPPEVRARRHAIALGQNP